MLPTLARGRIRNPRLFRSVPVETRTAGWTGERAIKSVRGGRVEEDVKSKSAFLRGLSRELCYRNTGLIF